MWSAIVEDLLTRSAKSEPGAFKFSPRQRLAVRRVRPIMLNNGYAFIAAPDEHAKVIVENELTEPLTASLTKYFGRPYSLTVSLAMPEPAPVPEPAPTPAPTEQPVAPPAPPTAAPSAGAPGEAPSGAPAVGATGSTPHGSAPLNPGIPEAIKLPSQLDAEPRAARDPRWDNTYTDPNPTNLDDLADKFAQTQPAPSGARIPREEPAHDPNRETSLNPHHTFESFVIGSSNRFANGAAVAVAESPAQAYNPLFIWGGSGLGKTHLLHAAGNYAKFLQPGLRVKYVSSEEFTNDYINSLRDDRQESFKRRYRNLDILMVDDIQFLEGKESTQEEFFHTFNALHQANKQIILSSDRPPKQLNTLEDRLRTRFEGGLITDIQPPDLETRIAILMKKAESDGTKISREILEMIASRFESSIRELEGALIRVSAYSSLSHQDITMETAELALRDLIPDSADRQITAATIIDITSDYFNVDPSDLKGAGKKRTIAHARQLAMYLCRELTELSLPKIGSEFGGKDHTTVMYAERKIKKAMNEDRQTYNEIQELTSKIQSAPRN
nr:chromosomal replication initiator protein DnaA [Corynebacterium phocae]